MKLHPGCNHHQALSSYRSIEYQTKTESNAQRRVNDMSSTKAVLTPLASLKVSRHQIPKHGLVPNTSIHNKPLLIYTTAFPSPSASQVESHLRSVGVFEPQWRYTMYSKSHFHSTTHEFLVVTSGSARVLLGGEGNPGAVETEVKAGDAILVPAGVSHRLLVDYGGFEMVGSYPVGATKWDMCYGRQGEDTEGIEKRIRALGWFERDPLYGEEGPALDV
ncbi:hypothetical protein NM688_g7941 [Phlebia brevispora]|uniref:Uncharacterized protein n=1 Tax=Phlebia brevispora TaxID=194682 RepID=A0ACC1RZF7_9APHY|nr:hypothetical protein NM688_g7941 [Phlebia brevispora]